MFDTPTHDSRFDPVLRQFQKDAFMFGRYGKTGKVTMSFGDVRRNIKFAGLISAFRSIPADAVGVCLRMKPEAKVLRPFGHFAAGKKFNSRHIIISDELRDAPIEEIEGTAYHELGHCILDKEHDDSVVMNGHGFHSFGPDRYHELRELFKNERIPRLDNYHLGTFAGNPQELKEIYKVDYKLLGQRIKYTLFQDPKTGAYFYDY